METEKVYNRHLNQLKEQDTRTLNETAVLQKQQNEINEDINRLEIENKKVFIKSFKNNLNSNIIWDWKI